MYRVSSYTVYIYALSVSYYMKNKKNPRNIDIATILKGSSFSPKCIVSNVPDEYNNLSFAKETWIKILLTFLNVLPIHFQVK